MKPTPSEQARKLLASLKPPGPQTDLIADLEDGVVVIRNSSGAVVTVMTPEDYWTLRGERP